MPLFPTPLILLLEVRNIYIQPRIDFGLAMHISSKTTIFSDPLLEPLPSFLDLKLSLVAKIIAMSNSQSFFDDIDEALGAGWVALRRF